MTVPGTPVSHTGQLIQLNHALEATAEGVDAHGRRVTLEAEVPFHLASSEPDPGLVVELLDEGDPSQVDTRSWAPVIVMSLIALVVLAGAAKTMSEGVFGLGAALAAIALIPGLFAYLALQRLRQQGRVGEPQAKVAPRAPEGYRQAGAEDEYEVTVWIKPDARPVRVEAVVAVREEIDQGRGEHRVQKRHDGWRSSQDLVASTPGEYRGRLPLPEPGSAAFPYGGAGSVNIRWVLLVGVHLEEGEAYWTERWC